MQSSDLVQSHYLQFDESTRLTGAFGEFEFARVQELILRHLSNGPLEVADVGGGTGAYSFWLASLGHRVHLIDVVPRHIDAAILRQTRPGPGLASVAVGDARTLSFPDGSVDVVLLAGPLYHLIDRIDRLRALRECHRVLRGGGLLLAIAINRYAGAVYGLTRGLVFDPEYFEMTVRELSTGVRRDPPPDVKTLPEAYFHLPTELTDEMAAAGFNCEPCLGVMGPAWQVPDLDAAWADRKRRETLLSLSRQVERECVLSPQLFCAGRKGDVPRALREEAGG
ncbi:MAG: class I SAM-dependent methyltransferase [Gemmatimonadota bacterium]